VNRVVVLGAVVLLGVLPAAGWPAEDATVSPLTVPRVCRGRFERARGELIRRGFAPTSDKDTARWLQVRQRADGGLELILEMRASADGAATFYRLSVRSSDQAGPNRWKRRRARFCCDEHAAEGDNLSELRWTREVDRLLAVVSVVQFTDDGPDPDQQRARDLFSGVARAAADDCLATAR